MNQEAADAEFEGSANTIYENKDLASGREALSHLCGRSWAEVDLDLARSNFLWLKNTLQDGCGIIAVVKADAYGHGAVALAETFVEAGAAMLAVSCLDEALELRLAGIKAPILMLSEAEPERHVQGIEAGLTYAVYNLEKGRSLSRAAVKCGKEVKVHIKIDSGMGRIGFPADEASSLSEIAEIMELPGLDVEGIFTHFATADGFDQAEHQGERYLQKQFKAFTDLISALEARGLHFRLRHCCNSPASLRHPEMHLDLVRPGLILYGLKPDNCLNEADGLKPLMSLHSRVEQVKVLKKGQSVSYGRRFVGQEEETLTATVPIGYADGYRRSMTGKAEALIGGRRCKLIGTICMDASIFDVTALKGEVKEGDEVVLWGVSGTDEITAEEIASWQDSINYEVPCSLSKRIPRVYFKDGKIVALKTFLSELRA